MECPECKSTDIRKFGWKILSGKKAQQWQCKKCGKLFREDKLVKL